MAKNPRGKGATNPMATFKRAVGLVFRYYPVQTTIMLICVVTAAVLSSFPSVFMQKAIDVLGNYWKSGDWAAAQPQILKITLTLIVLYVVALAAQATQTQLLALITQGTLMHVRDDMFDHMEDLPIRYFDTNKHGDIIEPLHQRRGHAAPAHQAWRCPTCSPPASPCSRSSSS